MHLSDNGNTLTINYSGKTTYVTYCIADFSGNVLMRGNFDELKENKISIENLRKGLYTFCIVDGDSLIKNRFLKDQ